VGKLYLPGHARYFGCRRCHELTWWSCQQKHRANWLDAMLGEALGMTAEEARRESHLIAKAARRPEFWAKRRRV
jgi:hypothetical protein